MSELSIESPLARFLNSDEISEEEKRSVAFQVVVALREAIGFGYKAPNPPTYHETMKFLYKLDTNLYEKFNILLKPVTESEDLRYYKDAARLMSYTSNSEVKPEFLINADIEHNLQLKRDAALTKEKAESIERKIRRLKSLLEELMPVKINENAVLRKDLSNDRKNLFAEKYLEEYTYTDFTMPNERLLRIRLLHPDQGEYTTGADLIYEQVDLITNKVRFVFLQYKMWDYNDKTLYFNERTFEQLYKLNEMLCCGKLCSSKQPTDDSDEFRFPYCSGFLRPTDRLQKANSKLISSGLYVPVCKAIRMIHIGNKIDKKEIQEYSLNHQVFEELFNLNLLGSQWFDFEEVEQLYRDRKILQSEGLIKLHCREFINSDFDEDPF